MSMLHTSFSTVTIIVFAVKKTTQTNCRVCICWLVEGGVYLWVSPQYLETSGEYVTVTWNDVESPSSLDWIGVYSPPLDDVYLINPAEHAPIKYQVCRYMQLRCIGELRYLSKDFLTCIYRKSKRNGLHRATSFLVASRHISLGFL